MRTCPEKEVSMKELFRRISFSLLIIGAFILALAASGCEGSDTKKTINDAVERVMGGDAVRKGEEMKKQVDQAMKEEARRLLKMNRENSDKDVPDKESEK